MSVKVVDYETTGFNMYGEDKIFAFIITDENMSSRIYRFDNISERKNNIAHEAFKEFHKDTSIEKVAHNAKFEMGFTSMYFGGSLPEGTWHDTIIMSQILKNLLQSHSLDSLATRYFKDLLPSEHEEWLRYDDLVNKHLQTQRRLLKNYPDRFKKEILYPLYDSGIKPLIEDRDNYGLVPREIMNGYQRSDGERGMLLYKLMWPELLKCGEKMIQDYYNEMTLLKTAQKMEQRGMMIHKRELKELVQKLENDLLDVENQKRKIFGFDINLDSPDQIQKHLFGYINPKKHDNLNDEWKIYNPVFNLQPLVMTKSGAPSADKESLESLRKTHPENQGLELILKYRAWAKSLTAIKSYEELAGDSMIIHPTMNTNAARTGRQSVSNPNLQNVSKNSQHKSSFGIPARKCFRPRPGYIYFLGDYAGIEMRLIISATNEEYLIQKLNEDMDYDVHAYNGNAILGDEFSKETDKNKYKNMRAGIKDATFGLAYGANVETFSRSIGKTTQEGREILKRYKEICPGICGFTKNMIDQVKNSGYITTAFGRKLYVEREKAYTASNYQIQGDAAGVLKRAQNNIDHYIMSVWDGDYDLIAMLLSVHDEIIVEMHRSLLFNYEQILHDLSYCMTDIKEIKVPLATEWKMSTSNWQDAKGIHI